MNETYDGWRAAGASGGGVPKQVRGEQGSIRLLGKYKGLVIFALSKRVRLGLAHSKIV